MGLDNGIYLRVGKDVKLPGFVKKLRSSYLMSAEDEIKYNAYELAYWRKCWDIRNKIIDTLRPSTEVGLFSLSDADITHIINILKKAYFTKSGIKSWDSFDLYYWGYDFHRLFDGLRYLRNLYWVRYFIKRHPGAKVYFYDSY